MPPLKGSGPLMNLLGLSPVLAIVAGIRCYRPDVARCRGGCFAVGLRRCSGSATSTPTATRTCSAHEVPFPSLGDALYLAVYPALMAGLLLLVRRRNAGARPRRR